MNSIPIYKPSKREIEHLFPVGPDGKRYCKACHGCGMWHCAYPEECGLFYVSGANAARRGDR